MGIIGLVETVDSIYFDLIERDNLKFEKESILCNPCPPTFSDECNNSLFLNSFFFLIFSFKNHSCNALFFVSLSTAQKKMCIKFPLKFF
jgi:hypothetical protein